MDVPFTYRKLPAHAVVRSTDLALRINPTSETPRPRTWYNVSKYDVGRKVEDITQPTASGPIYIYIRKYTKAIVPKRHFR